MTKAPQFGVSFSFQAHRALGEPYDKAYREGIELAAEAVRGAARVLAPDLSGLRVRAGAGGAEFGGCRGRDREVDALEEFVECAGKLAAEEARGVDGLVAHEAEDGFPLLGRDDGDINCDAVGG